MTGVLCLFWLALILTLHASAIVPELPARLTLDVNNLNKLVVEDKLDSHSRNIKMSFAEQFMREKKRIHAQRENERAKMKLPGCALWTTAEGKRSLEPDPDMCGIRIEAGSDQTVRVALTFYGLARHPSSSRRLPGIFMRGLQHQNAYNFVFDTFLNANLVLRTSKLSTDSRIDPSLWKSYAPCYATVQDQEEVDIELEPVFNATYKTYGSEWKNDGGDVSMNYLRSLYSMREAGRMIRAQERKQGFQYDIVILARLDVLWTHTIPPETYLKVMAGDDYASIFPEWGDWNGINDRFMLARRGAAMRLLDRLDHVAKYHNKLHSEKFLRWLVNNLLPPGAVTLSNALRFRRVRSDGTLVKAQYPFKKGSCVMNDVICPEWPLADLCGHISKNYPLDRFALFEHNGRVDPFHEPFAGDPMTTRLKWNAKRRQGNWHKTGESRK